MGTTHISQLAKKQEDVWAACLMEAAAPKAGNVTPQTAFADLCFADFVRSAEVIAPIMARATSRTIGRTIFEAVSQTRQIVGRNTNLGIVLLLAPLVAVKPGEPLQTGAEQVLQQLTREDADWAYRAINAARPGGMGHVEDHDLRESPRISLRQAMELAQDRDLVAAQYARGFQDVFEAIAVLTGWRTQLDWKQSIVGLHLKLLSQYPDSLIRRKCGEGIAEEASQRAQGVLAAGWPEGVASHRAFCQFDDWLRGDGNRRNPGTTADLVSATVYAALREGLLSIPDELRMLKTTALFTA